MIVSSETVADDEQGQQDEQTAVLLSEESLPAATDASIDFDHCTIEIHIKMKPVTTNASERVLLVSIRNDDDPVLLRQFRDLACLPDHLMTMVALLHADLPQRAIARAKRVAQPHTPPQSHPPVPAPKLAKKPNVPIPPTKTTPLPEPLAPPKFGDTSIRGKAKRESTSSATDQPSLFGE